MIIEAAGLLIFTRTVPERFLLMRHKDRWDLPKGHAEPGESIETTALRETEEETGIAAELLTLDPDFRFVLEYQVTGKRRGDYHKRVTYFLATIPDEVPIVMTEHIGYEWFDWPPSGSIQAQTIDPLLASVAVHKRSL